MTLEKDTKEVGNTVDNLGFVKDLSGRNDQPSFKVRHQSGRDISKETTLKIGDKHTTHKGGSPDDEVDLSCGIWRFRTNLLGKKFANLYVFTVFVGISMLFTQMVHSVINVQLTSIERQFGIGNAEAGLFDTASKAGHLTTILLAGHFAKKVNIPVVIGLSGMFQGIILMVPAFMQLANPYYLPTDGADGKHKDNDKYTCLNSNHSNNSLQDSDSKSGLNNGYSDEYKQIAYVVIIIVQVVKGITDTFHSGFLPTLYVDDNMVDKSKMAIFFGIKYVLGELASPVGKQLNAILTEVPVDLKETKIGPKDQRFIAAWWLAFLIFGGATAVFSFPIILFPRKLVSKRQQQEALQKAMVSFTTPPKKEETITDKIKTSDTIRTPSITVIGVKNGISASDRGKRSFTPKNSINTGSFYSHASQRKSSLFPPVKGPVERKVSADGSMVFEQPVSEKRSSGGGKLKSNLKELFTDFPIALARVFRRPVFLLMLVDIAIISIPMSGTSIFRSIYMTSEYNVSMTEVARLTGVTSAVSHIIGTLVSSWLASKVKTKIGYIWIIFITYLITVGITPLYLVFGCDNQPIYGHTGRFGIATNMTDMCDCSSTQQLISCGSDGNNYLTPCHAGCSNYTDNVFTNCSGLVGHTLNDTMTLVTGLCDTNCQRNFYLYVALHAIQGMFSSMASIPRRLLILRIVDPSDRAFATSLFAFFGTILAIPSPNLFGRVIDDTCLVKDGSVCTIYDRDRIRYLMSGIDVGVQVCVQISFILMVCVFKYEERTMKRKMKKENNGDTGDKEIDIKI